MGVAEVPVSDQAEESLHIQAESAARLWPKQIPNWFDTFQC